LVVALTNILWLLLNHTSLLHWIPTLRLILPKLLYGRLLLELLLSISIRPGLGETWLLVHPAVSWLAVHVWVRILIYIGELPLLELVLHWWWLRLVVSHWCEVILLRFRFWFGIPEPKPFEIFLN